MTDLLCLLVFLWGAWLAYEVSGQWGAYQRALNVAWLFKFHQAGDSWEDFQRRRTWERLLKPLEEMVARLPFGFIRNYRVWVERQLRRAGVMNLGTSRFLSLQILTAGLALPCSLVLFGGWRMGMSIALLSGGFGPLAWLHLRAQKREQETMNSLPEALELLSVGMEAGLDFGGALRVYVHKGPGGLLHSEFSKVLQDFSTGKTRPQALHGLMERLPFEFISSPMGTILQGLRLGAGIASLLRSQAEHLRTLRWEAVQKKAQEAPVKLLFPLLIFIFPTIFMVLFGPFVISLTRSGF